MISTIYNTSKDELYHHGIKGMKWGVRRYQNEDGTLTEAGKKRYYDPDIIRSRDGDDIFLYRQKASGLAKILANHNKNIRNEQDRTYIYDGYVNGKKVADLQLYKESKTSMNVVWLGVDKRERGKGYAQAILKNAIAKEKENGFKQFTLEVPGDSPDARHIYEKMGFKSVGKITGDDDIWGGLTAMKKDLK